MAISATIAGIGALSPRSPMSITDVMAGVGSIAPAPMIAAGTLNAVMTAIGSELPYPSTSVRQQLFDRVWDLSTTTGNSDFTLAGTPPSGYQAFSSVLNVTDEFLYAIHNLGANEFETGMGVMLGSTTFRRLVVFSSSNAGALVNFSAGTKNCFVTPPFTFLRNTVGRVNQFNSPYTMLSSDRLLIFRGDAVNAPGNASLQAITPLTPITGIVFVADFRTTQSNGPGPRVTANASAPYTIEDVNNPGTLLAPGSSTTLRTFPQKTAWMFDGDQFVLYPGS